MFLSNYNRFIEISSISSNLYCRIKIVICVLITFLGTLSGLIFARLIFARVKNGSFSRVLFSRFWPNLLIYCIFNAFICIFEGFGVFLRVLFSWKSSNSRNSRKYLHAKISPLKVYRQYKFWYFFKKGNCNESEKYKHDVEFQSLFS